MGRSMNGLLLIVLGVICGILARRPGSLNRTLPQIYRDYRRDGIPHTPLPVRIMGWLSLFLVASGVWLDLSR